MLIKGRQYRQKLMEVSFYILMFNKQQTTHAAYMSQVSLTLSFRVQVEAWMMSRAPDMDADLEGAAE